MTTPENRPSVDQGDLRDGIDLTPPCQNSSNPCAKDDPGALAMWVVEAP
jgi:hypothetical protein